MSAPIDWYFDFISPYAYLQWRRIRRDHPGMALVPRPVLLAGLLKHWGQLGPAEIPGKRTHTYRQVLWQARQAGVPLTFPPAHPFNPLPALRLSLAATDRVVAVDAIFSHIWEHGLAADTAEALAPLRERMGVGDIAAAIAMDTVKLELAQNGEKAIALGIFGVPTMVIDGHLFWGNDATDMAQAYLADGTLFDDAQMRRGDTLPAAVQRFAPRTGTPDAARERPRDPRDPRDLPEA